MADFKIIEPKNLQDLVKAIELRDFMQEKLNKFFKIKEDPMLADQLKQQEAKIDAYAESIPNFDNTKLIRNIAYLTRKTGLRIGDLEKMLGISTGYISRIAKENSTKKFSIDTVCKISEIFGVSVSKLINDDVVFLSGNIDLLVDFMSKLSRQTDNVEIEWELLGSSMPDMNERIVSLGLFEGMGDGRALYKAPGRNPKQNYLLADNVIGTFSVDGYKELIIVPFTLEGEDRVHYDFMFASYQDGANGSKVEKIFYSTDDPYGALDNHAAALYETASNHFMDVPVTENVRNFISSYLED